MICQLLGSKSITDVLEAVEFFITGFEFGLGIMMMGIRRMLPLIWSRESGIKEAVVGAYKRLYLSPADSNQRYIVLADMSQLCHCKVLPTMLGIFYFAVHVLSNLHFQN